jgi:predicted kinase
VPFGILYCDAPCDELVRRLTQRATQPGEVSDADTAVMEKQFGLFEPPTTGEGPVCVCPNGGLPADWRSRLALR